MAVRAARKPAVEAENSAAEAPAEMRASLVDQAYSALQRAIIESVFAPGHQVSAQELASRFGMSRTPIHEACLRLQEEGLVRIIPKKGIQICAISPEDMREIFQVIVSIEGDAAALAARLPAAERASLADALDAQTDRMERAPDFLERGLGDAAFHRLLVEHCRNRRFASIMQTVNNQSHRARVLTVRMRPNLERSVPEHRAIAAAIRHGDPETAFAAARAHRSRARDDILPIIESMGLRHL